MFNTQFINVMIENKGFSSRKITAELLDAETVKFWHSLCDELLVASYDVACKAHNGEQADISAIYAVLGKIFKQFPQFDNGAILRSDSDSALTMMRFSATEKNAYSADYQYKQSQVRNEKSYLRTLCNDKGEVYPQFTEKAEEITARIEVLEAELADLKKIAFSVSKQTTRVAKGTFYKKVEDYIAEKALGLLAKTNEEIVTEEKARKDARNKKANARKAAKAKATK